MRELFKQTQGYIIGIIGAVSVLSLAWFGIWYWGYVNHVNDYIKPGGYEGFTEIREGGETLKVPNTYIMRVSGTEEYPLHHIYAHKDTFLPPKNKVSAIKVFYSSGKPWVKILFESNHARYQGLSVFQECLRQTGYAGPPEIPIENRDALRKQCPGAYISLDDKFVVFQNQNELIITRCWYDHPIDSKSDTPCVGEFVLADRIRVKIQYRSSFVDQYPEIYSGIQELVNSFKMESN